MKQIVSNYSYSPATNVVTLTGVNIDQDQLLLVVAPQVGRTMYNFASGVTGAVSAGADTRVTLNASTAGLTTTSPLVIFYDDQASTQTVAGTVTANVSTKSWFNFYGEGTEQTQFLVAGGYDSAIQQIAPIPLSEGAGGVFVQQATDWFVTPVQGSSVTIGSLPAISGTVTANLGQIAIKDVGTSFVGTDSKAVQSQLIRIEDGEILGDGVPFWVFGSVTVGNSVTIGSLPTVAPQLPRVTFIDGSGTVTTANTAITVFASSSTRSYLLVQVTTGSAFVNVGATATTVNGINLTAGQGYAWETTIPQGIVSLISTTTSSRWVAKEA